MTEGDSARFPSLEGLTIRPRVPDDDPNTVAIFNQLNPDLPPQTVEEYRDNIDRVPPHVKREILTTEYDGRIVGLSVLLEMFWVTPPGPYIAEAAVDPDFWGRGIGTQLYERIVQRSEEFRPTKLYSQIREDDPSSKEFARRRGFRPTGRVERRSRLEVAKANREGFDGLEEHLAKDGIRVKTVAELGAGDDALRMYHRVQQSAAKDEPSSEGFSMPFEQWHEFFVGQVGTSFDAMWLALHEDEPIGTTMMRRNSDHAASSGGMGVERAYRGRGVARLLKLRTVDWAAENGIDFLYTGNDLENPRMLDINMRIGFQPLPASVEFVKELT